MSIYNDSNYYVYLYLRPDYTPYYVGKGKGKRAWSQNHSINLPPKSRIIIIQDNITELQSFILERYYIRWFGRKDNGTGILRNRTDGGDGTSGYTHTEETKNKTRKSLMGHQVTLETRNKISMAKKGKKHSIDRIQRRKNRKNVPLSTTDNTIFIFKHSNGTVYTGILLSFKNGYEPKIRTTYISDWVSKKGYHQYKDWYITPG